MDIRRMMRKGLSLQKQAPGMPEGGPISLCLSALSRNLEDEISGIQRGRPISPVGADLASIYARRSLRVLFVDTGGSGVAPWRGLIILDTELRGKGQVKSPATLAMIAHELTHLLQREFNQPHYWPAGKLRPRVRGRWVGDSTNYMEVLSYIVGWTVEYDLTAARIGMEGRTTGQNAKDGRTLARIKNRLATLTGTDPHNACRLVVKLFPNNAVYRKNFELENRTADGRIPPGSWHSWLRQMGFSSQSIDHILILASQGQAEWIKFDQVTRA
jgi:hypothetical protein